jgi:hypothetical protein
MDESRRKEVVRVYDNVLTDDICEQMIAGFNRCAIHPDNDKYHIVERATIGDSDETLSTFRNTDIINFRGSNVAIIDKPLADLCWDTLLGAVYTNAVKPYNDDMGGALDRIFPWRIWQVDMLKYTQGVGFYKQHVDSDDGIMTHRVFSLIVYLNDVEEGGETLFPWQGLVVTPKKGRAVLFPSTWPYPHQATIPISDDKYVMAIWAEPDDERLHKIKHEEWIKTGGT